jgi:predicted RNA methylase
MAQVPDLGRAKFARTNVQTIAQRAALIRELLPATRAIAELCCGDCAAQFEMYCAEFGAIPFCGLDVSPEIVALNRARNILCVQGDVMDADILRSFLKFDILFFGPPLSVECDGHRLLVFREVVPSFADFARVLWRELQFRGTCVFICPNTTTPGDARYLYEQIKAWRADVGLRLLHYSRATQTGNGESHELRLKYIELWFSSVLPDQREIRNSFPASTI